MELTTDEVEECLEEIFSRMRLVEINGREICFKHPTPTILIKARHVKKMEYKSAIEDGFLTKDDLKKLLKKRNLITDDDKKRLTKLQSQLEAQKVLLAKTTKVKANQDRIKSVIERLENEIAELEYKELSRLGMSAEVKASEMWILYLCWSCTYSYATGNLYWTTFDEFLNEKNIIFRQNVIVGFRDFYGGFSIEKIRAVARHNLWRIRYLTSVKTSDPLFGIPTSDYTPNMINLAYWSHYYQNIFEMLPEDQPPESIIDDDEALDAYMEDYYKERQKEALSRKSKANSPNSRLSAFDQEEVIVTRSNELYEDIEYDVPKEAQIIKDRNLIRKKARRG